ncbi:MAG TPA: arabinan endo-1,5-alpha-L-arabinosidase [Acidimicrobiales bacterium]|nr:arabinan endo-1,5-alpha-L-arabinosidase [Acidimicrobiales bacterium]
MPASAMTAATSATSAAPPVRTVPVPSYVYVHDPSMANEGGTWYLFSTGDPNGLVNHGNVQVRESANLISWKLIGTVFQQIPSWINDDLAVPPTNLWAPDISYFDGLWHLYYAASNFGGNTSIIALATNRTLDPKSPEYHWEDDREVFSSSTADDFNAIDPALATGANGSKWLVFGSFWSGIKLVAIDPATGKPQSPHPHLYSLSSAPAPDPEEGSYLISHGGYYYLFVSEGYCCKGIASTYEVIVGRSQSITGPYLGPDGAPMTGGGGMELLGSSEGMIGPGAPSVYVGPGGDLVVYHYYDAWDLGDPWVQVRRLYWASDGWPVTGPAIVPVPGAPLVAGAASQ